MTCFFNTSQRPVFLIRGRIKSTIDFFLLSDDVAAVVAASASAVVVVVVVVVDVVMAIRIPALTAHLSRTHKKANKDHNEQGRGHSWLRGRSGSWWWSRDWSSHL